MTATLHADADAMHLVADLIGAGHADVSRAVMVLHVEPQQADDLLERCELASNYISRDGHTVHNAWLFGWGTVRIVVDRDPAAILADLPAGVGGFPCGGREAT